MNGSSSNPDTWRIQRLQALVVRAGGQAAAGRMLGYRDGAFVGQMLRGTRPITEKTVRAVEALPGYRHWFDPAGTPAKIIAADADAPPYHTRMVRIPVLATRASMGAGCDIESDDVIVGSLPVSPDWIARRVRPSSVAALRIIHAHGDSMSPTMEDGDIALVDTDRRDPSGADGVYVLASAERVYIKRVTERFAGGHDVTSDNPSVKIVQELNGGNDLRVLGRVVWVWNGRKL